MRGTKLGTRFDQDENLIIEELDDYSIAVNMLLTERIDAIAGSLSVLTYQLKQRDLERKIDITNYFTIGTKEQWLLMSQKSGQQHLISSLSNAVTELKEKGEFTRILMKHYRSTD